MKMFILLGALLFGANSYAQNKEEINAMLEQFKKNGMFSEAQIEEAKRELEKMNDEDLKKIRAQADQKLQDPKVQEELKKLQNK
jgi:hypothetical protein